MKGVDVDGTRRVIAEEAARWLCELREGGTAEQEALLLWLRRSPMHVKEFLLASAVWKEMDHVGPKDSPGIERVVAEARASAADAQVFTLGETPFSAGVAPMMRSRTRMVPLAAAATVLALMLAAAWYFLAGSNRYATGIGEQRIVRLDDGSVVQLNTGSRIAVNYEQDGREVRLLEGEALFKVARDAARVFRVRAGDAVVVALGTEFNVYRHGGAVTVSVVEGAVQVARTSPAPFGDARGIAPERLNAGEQASVESSGHVRKRAKPDLAQAVAWRQRRLVFRGETLEDIAAEFNRYTNRSIRVDGKAARSKRLAGTFSADDPDSLALFLGEYPDLAVEKEGSGFVVKDR